MSHPAIPPKSEFFGVWLGEESFLMPDGEDRFGYMSLDFDGWDRETKMIFAAVAEVEWRKRADRWANHASENACDYTDESLPRFLRFRRNAADCEYIALLWREWGQTK